MNIQNVFCTERWNRPRPRIKVVPDVNQAWTEFKSHLIILEDQTMQDRINFLVDSAVAIISTSRSIISQFGFPTSGIKPFYFKDMTRGKIGSELIGITVTYYMICAEVVHMLKHHSLPLVSAVNNLCICSCTPHNAKLHQNRIFAQLG